MKFNKRKVGNKMAYSKNAASAKSISTHKQRKREKIHNIYNYIYIHTHTHTHTFTHTHTHTHIYIYIYIFIHMHIWLVFRKGYRQLQAQSPEYPPPPLPNFPVPSSYKNGNCLNIRSSLDILDNIHPRK